MGPGRRRPIPASSGLADSPEELLEGCGASGPGAAPVGTIGLRSSRLNPYLNFNGNARQAMEFYASVFGRNLSLNTFAQFGAEGSPDAERIMHGMLETDVGYTIMGADITSDMEYHPMAGFSVSLGGDDADVLRGCWEKLSASA
jgi:PhnB protein